MVTPSPSTFNCDSCAQPIQSQDPRGRCTVCPDYDLCAKCFLGERFTNGHDINHDVQVFRQSGGGSFPSLPASRVTALQPSSSSLSTSSYPPASQAPNNGTLIRQPSQTVSGWQPFFRDDMSPTPTFLTLINDIFTYLDPFNNGNLEPEVFSQLLDDMGVPVKENGCKDDISRGSPIDADSQFPFTGRSALQESGTMSKESNADKSLKSIYDMFSIEHVLLLRTRPVIQPAGGGSSPAGFARAFRNAVAPQVSHQGPMPAITRRGFIELFTINQLSEPSTEWAALSRALRKFQLPKYAAWGDMPRSVLPEMPHPGMVQRVENVKKYALQKSLEAVEAARVDAMIRARGRQAALDILGNTKTEYVYRYR